MASLTPFKSSNQAGMRSASQNPTVQSAPPPSPLTKNAAEIALIKAKCRFKQYDCSLPHLEGYSYCLQHILEDKNAPYKTCSYVYPINGRPCTKAAHKGDRRNNGLCPAHARKEEVKRQKSSLRRYPSMSVESLLTDLRHYVKSDSKPSSSIATATEDKEAQDRALDPFAEIDAPSVSSSASRILDYASESDSDIESAMLDSTWKEGDADADSSDAESVDSTQEDLLKHAGVFTSEEAMQVTRDKLIRLQSLYIEQFRRLQHVLRERRRKYLHSLKREKESLCSISSQARTSPRELKLYDKLKALNHYHRRNGVEAVLHKKALERRASVTEGMSVRPTPHSKCIYTEGGVKCAARTLPSAKLCPKHILQDEKQVLFRPCGCKTGPDSECREPLPDILENAYCVYHTTLAAQPKLIMEKSVKVEPSSSVDGVEDQQDQQLHQLQQQLQQQLEQHVDSTLALPDSLNMDIVLDDKNPDNFISNFEVV